MMMESLDVSSVQPILVLHKTLGKSTGVTTHTAVGKFHSYEL